MESETTEILHCPFCGSRCAARGAVGSRWVFCTDDDVCGYVGTEGPDAIAAHNTVAAAVRDHAAAVAERDALRAQVRAFCAAVGLPYPLPGGTNDGPIDNDDRPTRTGHGVRLSPRRRRLGYVARTRRSAGSGVAPMRATPPAVERLTVRDARRRERMHMAGQWALLFVGVGLLVGLVMGGAFGGGHWADHLGGGR